MNIYNILKIEIEKIKILLQAEQKLTFDSSTHFSIETPKEKLQGDISTNVAIVYAKSAKMSPRALAEAFITELEKLDFIEKAEIAGPGFINFFLKASLWYEILAAINERGTYYGDCTIGEGLSINLEYVSVNPTGPMHIGHARCAAYGDSLSLVLKKAGYDVTKEYYINDAGKQIDVLAESAYLRYLEALGQQINIPSGLYPGDYLIQTGNNLAQEFDDKLSTLDKEEAIKIIRPLVTNQMMDLIKHDLANLGIYHDEFISELNEVREEGLIEEGIELLKHKGLIYQGTLEKPKGHEVEDWEEQEQIIFKSTQFGDDQDRVVIKPDGTYTYFAGDIGYALHKIKRGFDKFLYVLGADHAGYVKRLKSIVQALSDGKIECEVKICQLVNFLQNGQELKMSKRAGNYVTVEDIYNMVGKDVIRLMMLTRKNDISLNFDVATVKEQSKDNPVFYIQYAYARIRSVGRMVKLEHPDLFEEFEDGKIDLSLLSLPHEINLIKLMASWPKIVESAAIHHEPHRIIFYAQELASQFHALWNMGREDPTMRFIVKNNPQLTQSRLFFTEAIANILASSMLLCNVQPMEEM
ncbi:arginine--tRNA ligase [Rickettsiales endosymbiont of Stachyamoeba lipophora]|uniref:arginine--tRNA ligase n=1 Tax=Rickettsiales endosymbiont of Stachyamoeba lipophora TaxID=2486578 RepID=UPI000F654976|nr:arginine--tRNA ligase [Rickettsiales endosymbiont of Stachyamoeba lipophora]AZL15356.1 arginine--tRNA ligase [Rickettsiales endosymbiont of Stachyamoeba lipophora]